MRPRQSSLGIGCRGCQSCPGRSGFNEAEAIKPRNLALLAHTRFLVGRASMRPRQSSLGIARPLPNRRNHGRACFNEAEAIKPRNPVARNTAVRRRGSCFNEAEAIKPRNPDPVEYHMVEEGRFNEAEAIKPRNRRATTRRTARRSACFNEAEAIKPRNPGPRANCQICQ